MMLREGMAHGSVAGSIATTAMLLAQEFFALVSEKECRFFKFLFNGFPDRVFSFGDCAVNPNPDANQLADIAIATADNHKRLTGEEPYIAMLSFSTKGSAEHELVDKVRQATASVKSKRPDLKVDGELQFDAAVVDSVERKKLPEAKLPEEQMF
jgi:phosphate acetyltransferase